MGVPMALQFLGKLDALREGRQLVVDAVGQADWGQAYQTVQHVELAG